MYVPMFFNSVKHIHAIFEVLLCIRKDYCQILLTLALSVWTLIPSSSITSHVYIAFTFGIALFMESKYSDYISLY